MGRRITWALLETLTLMSIFLLPAHGKRVKKFGNERRHMCCECVDYKLVFCFPCKTENLLNPTDLYPLFVGVSQRGWTVNFLALTYYLQERKAELIEAWDWEQNCWMKRPKICTSIHTNIQIYLQIIIRHYLLVNWCKIMRIFKIWEWFLFILHTLLFVLCSIKLESGTVISDLSSGTKNPSLAMRTIWCFLIQSWLTSTW